MAIVTTKAIVISAIKYGDSSLIAKLYTEKSGLISYMIKGVLKSKKGKLRAAYFQPLTQLNIVASHQEKRNLQSLREVQISSAYSSIHLQITKQTLAIFLSEILSNVIQEEEPNSSLFNYLQYSLLWLDTHEKIANFHIIFLINLTKYLGFYPGDIEGQEKGFHLREGIFTNQLHEKEVIKGGDFFHFKKLLGTNFDTVESISFLKSHRQSLLRILIRYFELHLDGFKKPKSLDILEAVFSK